MVRDLPGSLAVVKEGPSRETWLLRILAGALLIILSLVVLVVVIGFRIDSRADKTVRALEAAAERDRAALVREQAQARVIDAFRRLALARTPEERAAAAEALREAESAVPEPSSSPRSTQPARTPASTTAPSTSSTTSSSTSTTTTTTTTTTTQRPPPPPPPEPEPAPSPIEAVCRDLPAVDAVCTKELPL